VDEDKRKRAYDLSDSFAELGLASIVTDMDHIRKYPEAIAVAVFVPSENYLNKVSVRCGKIPIIAINESGSRIYNKDVVFYSENFHGKYDDFIFSFIFEKYGILKGDYSCGELRIVDDKVTLGIAYLKLTKSERRILSMLIVCGGWVSEHSILKACFKNTGKKSSTRVPVHICNINKKTKGISGRPIILTKRGIGYMVDRNI